VYIDSHCHLERETYGDTLEAVLARATAAGVTHLVAVGASGGIAGAREAVALAARVPQVVAAVGLHPHEASKIHDADLAALRELLTAPKVVALGEIGLDYHYDFSPPEVQRHWFRRLLQLGKDAAVPVMLHVREADSDVCQLLDEVGLSAKGGLVHCFTGGPHEAEAYLKRGFYLSIPGVITFRNADKLREAVRAIPLERLLIETDSPYLAPIPHRGKKNEPAHIVHTAAAIAPLKGMSAEDIGRITAQNAAVLYGLDYHPAPALAYAIRNSLYINLTSRCTLSCRFCPKVERRDFWVRGHYLRHQQDPEAPAVIEAVLGELRRRPELDEVVFVGLGESTLRLPELVRVAGAVREAFGRRFRLRLDTDGLANLVHGRDVTRELAACVDALSVSLNAPDRDTYARLCPSRYGAAAYDAVKAFIRAAKECGLHVTASAVGVPGLDLDACRQVAEGELGVEFRHRQYQQVG